MTDTVLAAAPRRRRKIAPRADWLLRALVLLPLLVMIGKLPGVPGAPMLNGLFAVDHVPDHARHLVDSIFLVPVGALVVVVFRRVLGLRVLGFFRPILLAVAFASVGVVIGTACLAAFLGFIAAVRPLLRGAPYNTRIPVLLSLVSAILALLLAAGEWWHLGWLEQAAYFPVIALCLTCESFAKVLERDGMTEAGWLTATTVAAAALITAATGVPGFMALMYRMPELLLLEAAAILLLARHLSLRLLEGWNPFASRRATAPAGGDEDQEAAERRHDD